MKKHFCNIPVILCALLLTSGLLCLNAQTESAIQSTASPFNLSVDSPVYVAGSDDQSADFMANDFGGLMELVNQNLNEQASITDVSAIALDPSKLYLSMESDVRVYFLGEGAGYHNTLGYNTEGIGISEGNPTLIFPDASSSSSWLSSSSNTRTASEPLMAGDFVDLGTLGMGTQLDFFLIANGANSADPNRVWTAWPDYNSDGIQHMVAFAIEDSPYLVIGFEDLTGGGDKDYNDLVIAIDIGARNVAVLANPEPSTLITLTAILGFVLIVARRERKKNSNRLPIRD